MNNLILDTDIFIDLLRGFEKAKAYFEEAEDSRIYFSAITEAELISGRECDKIEKRTGIIELLSHFNKVPVVNEIAAKAGDFCRIYGVETADAIIAATAFFMKADLVTRNIGDYKKIKEITVKVPY